MGFEQARRLLDGTIHARGQESTHECGSGLGCDPSLMVLEARISSVLSQGVLAGLDYSRVQ